MKAAINNVIQSKGGQTKTNAPNCAPIDPSKEPDLLSPEIMLLAKKIVKWILYLMVVVGIPLSFWLFIGTDYAMMSDKFAWIAILAVFGVFFIKFVTNDLGWSSIMKTFKWFALVSILLIIGKESLFHKQVENKGKKESSAVEFSLIGAGQVAKAKVAEFLKKAEASQKTKDQTKTPDYREFKIGRKNGLRIDNMKKGEGLGYFVRAPRGFPTLQFLTSLGTGVKAILRDGTEYDLSNRKPLPNGDYDFKLVAYENGAKIRLWFERK